MTARILIALLLLLAGWMPSQWGRADSLESVLMPGKVIQGHAKTEGQCNKCHVRFNRAGQDALCGDCHKDVARDVAQKQGFHGRAREGKPCRECHTEHKGRDARLVVLDEKKFDHRQTDYLLKGKHLETECKQCHRPATKYRNTQAACIACHQKDDEHQGKLGTKCADCHTETSWKEAKFDHDQTRFKLEDKHVKVECKACHKDNVFKNTPVACASCHRKDDTHKGRFGDKCQTCHNAKAWNDVLFDHDRDTKYALRGKHEQAKCGTCHTGNLYRDKLQSTCIACHKKDDKHKNTLGEKCADCHVERNWTEARFDHGKSRFPLRGKHDDIECKACHKSPVFKETPMTCIACHRKQDKHKGALGELCGDCHGERNWKEYRFDHDKTKFALLGKHREAKCDTCHKDEKYKNTPTACLACHRKDDVHKGQQGEKCEACHDAGSWKRSSFNHGRSRFPLVGGHVMVECKKCHLTAQYKDAKSECLACHDKDDVHKRRLGTRCDSCHNARSWRAWDFNHDTRTRFRLDGGHRGLDCYTCHKSPVAGKAVLPMSCVSCHDKDDVHDGSFGPKCNTCHETDSFKRIKSRLGGAMPVPSQAAPLVSLSIGNSPLVRENPPRAFPDRVHRSVTMIPIAFPASPYRLFVALLAIFLAALLTPFPAASAATPSGNARFDHITTGFRLTGAHTNARCESCHARGVFKGTPTQCSACHTGAGQRATSLLPANHIPTKQSCNTCHNTTTFSGARFDHTGVAPGSCATCHNGSRSKGKPSGHIATTAPCDSCHKTSAWTPAKFSHASVAAGSCSSCHNGTAARGKHSRHIATTASCDSCHKTTAWTPATFSHNGVAPGTCSTCHNGSTAKGKPSGHIPTTAPCDTCHKTAAWTPATFSHRGIAPGTCSTCHNGSTAKGKPSGHVPTTAACDTCHKTTAWTPATFSHSGVAPGTCSTCHNGSTAKGKPSRHIATTASCDSCHKTTAWTPATFSHSGVAPGTCSTCHNGSTAKGKPSGHIPTTAACDTCHKTSAWTPATFSHSGVAPGTCSTCHNGSTAKGKPSGHIPTTAACDTCHKTTAWTPATFSHSGVAPGTCSTCHNGSTAKGKPSGHIPTTAACDTCHKTTAWTPATFSHSGVAPGTCSTCHNGSTAKGKPSGHIPTTASCDSCHRTTAWLPATFSHSSVAPGTCSTCHNGSTAKGKPSGHVPTTASCDTCHKTTGWTPATFSHSGVAPGTCSTCHNGSTAKGKPSGHIPTTASCDGCHRTAAWLPATFSHSGVAPGTCTTCHNGSIAKGKPSGHIPTTASCDSCHRTTAWLPATFSHSGVAPGTCSTCHNGTTAKGKPSGHIPTTASCDSCHRTTAWLPASFSHSSVAPGTCSSCHNGSAATGKPTGHFVTSRACDTCHTTTAWAPPKAYTHVSPFYKAHNSGVTCASCHTSNSEFIAWKFSAYKPDCAGCHASTFKPDAHKKVDSPRILYTVGELKNCSGSCHEYTDNTFTTIKRTRTGEHRSTGGDF